MAEIKVHGDKDKTSVEMPLGQYFSDCYEEVVQLAGEFAKELGKERALAVAERMNTERAVSGLRRKLDKLPHDTMDDFIEYHRGFHGTDFAKAAQTEEEVEIGPKRYVFIMRKCHWAETFRELGAADLGYALNCSSDFAYARCFNPKLRLERSKTLMQGDDCCEFVYTWED